MASTTTVESLRKSLAKTTTLATVSSRLGHDLNLHRHVCRFLTRSLLDCRSRNATLIIATGSAIEPWATRAAELFDVHSIRIAVGKDDPGADFFVPPVKQSRDRLVIELADRVDAIYVRAGGNIDNSLCLRINARQDASTRVAVAPDLKCAAARLIASGAIGWFDSETRRRPSPNSTLDQNLPPDLEQPSEQEKTDQWTRTDGQWLVHCTRGPRANWPDETIRQFRDSILIGDGDAINRQPIDSLCRILRSGRLIASSTATSKQSPVVCFSAVPLAQLLDRRCFRPQLGRWDYEPFGIAIRRSTAVSLGIKPVIYGEPGRQKTLAQQDRYRFHPIGKTYDWQSEKEWRSKESVDLTTLPESDVRVFAADTIETRNRLADCPWAVSFVTQSANQSV